MQNLSKKIYFPLLCLLFIPHVIRANAAAPAPFNAGAGHNFIPFYPEDAPHIGKIIMQRELVIAHLYQGYAVIKGEYYMYNTSPDTVTITTGYPKNGSLNTPRYLNDICFNALYDLQVYVNDQLTPHQYKEFNAPAAEQLYKPQTPPDKSKPEWYVWKCSYPPKQLTKLTIYFLVQTYKLDGFVYVLESGRIWGNTVGEGRIFIRLKDDLEEDDIEGALPLESLVSNQEGVIIYDFKNLEPSAENNVVLRYDQDISDFDLDKIRAGVASLYAALDQETATLPLTSDFELLQKDDFGSYDDPYLGLFIFIFTFIVGGVFVIIWAFVPIFKAYQSSKT